MVRHSALCGEHAISVELHAACRLCEVQRPQRARAIPKTSVGPGFFPRTVQPPMRAPDQLCFRNLVNSGLAVTWPGGTIPSEFGAYAPNGLTKDIVETRNRSKTISYASAFCSFACVPPCNAGTGFPLSHNCLHFVCASRDHDVEGSGPHL